MKSVATLLRHSRGERTYGPLVVIRWEFMAAKLDQRQDEQLAMDAQAGDPEAWGELVRRYYPRVLRYLSAQLRDPEVAAEVAQETFLTAGSILRRYQGDRSFAGWLFRIAQNHTRRHWRRRVLGRVLSLEQLNASRRGGSHYLRQPGDVADLVVDSAIIDQTLAEISQPLRDALLLNAVAGLAAPAVAAVLGISVSSAERRISRAKVLFRNSYNLKLDSS